MIIRRGILQFTTALMLLGTFAFAQVPEELNEVVLTGNVFGRSSPDFSRKSRNIQSTLKAGSKGVVVESRRMRSSGSYAVKIRLTDAGAGKGRGNTKVGDEVWVYYNKKNPWMKFRDSQDMEVQNPESALSNKTRKSGKESADLAPANDKSVDPNEAMPSGDRSQTEAGTGDNCRLNNSCGSSANHDSLKRVADKLLDDEIRKGSPKSGADNDKETAAKKDAATFAKYKRRKYTMERYDWSNFPEVMKAAESKKTTKTIKAAMNGRESGSTSKCWRYVKRALVSGRKIGYPPTEHAKEAVGVLKNLGFKNLMDPPYKGIIKSPDDAPKGSIIVYETKDPNESGDIQIKTEWGTMGGYVSDYFNSESFLEGDKADRFRRAGKPYKIIGVMIKP